MRSDIRGCIVKTHSGSQTKLNGIKVRNTFITSWGRSSGSLSASPQHPRTKLANLVLVLSFRRRLARVPHHL